VKKGGGKNLKNDTFTITTRKAIVQEEKEEEEKEEKLSCGLQEGHLRR
jgi:hypothetical protein